jgi:hypothetical protein
MVRGAQRAWSTELLERPHPTQVAGHLEVPVLANGLAQHTAGQGKEPGPAAGAPRRPRGSPRKHGDGAA